MKALGVSYPQHGPLVENGYYGYGSESLWDLWLSYLMTDPPEAA